MTLRVGLVIEGDASGAKQALAETRAEISNLETAAGGAADNTKRLADTADEASGKVKQVGSDSQTAATGIVATGSAAEGASGKLGVFSKTLATVLGTIGGALIGGAIGAAMAILADQTIRFVAALIDNGPTIAETLRQHKELIAEIKDLYEGAARGVEDYGRKSATILRFEAQQDVARLERAANSLAAFNTGDVTGRTFTFGEGLFQKVREAGPFFELIEKFNEDIRRGNPDVIKFREEVAALASTLPKDSPFRQTAQDILDFTKAAADSQAELARAKDALKGLEGDSDAAARALGRLPKGFDDAGEAAARQAESLAKFKQELQELGGGGLAAPAVGRANLPGTLPNQFAVGGIVTAPTLFAYGGGQLGLMGEAGPEAILPMQGGGVGAIGRDGRERTLPLARLASGKLGVRAYAAGGVIGEVVESLREFTLATVHGQSATEALSSAVLALSDRLINSAINNLFSTVFPKGGADLFGGLLSGFAAGGVISGRSAMPALRAPTRFASGAAITGRALASPRTLRPAFDALPAFGGGGPTVNNFYVSTPNPRAFGEDRISVIRGARRLASQGSRFS